MEFRTYILRIFIHPLVNSKSNELPQSLGGLWCFLLLLSSPFVFFLGFKVIFKIFKLCGMAKQANKQTKKWSFGFFLVSDTSYNTYIPVVFFTIVFTFLPPISIEILACLTDSYSLRAKSALKSFIPCNFAIFSEEIWKVNSSGFNWDLTREVHKR